MLHHHPHRQSQCKTLKRLTVNTKPQSTGQRHINNLGPRPTESIKKAHYTVNLTIQPLKRQRRQPVIKKNTWKTPHIRRTCKLRQRIADHTGITLTEIRGTRHQQLGDHTTVTTPHLGIIHTHNVQHHRIIRTVRIMAMTPPVTGTHVYLNIPGPHLTVNAHLRIEKVRPGINIEPALVYDLYPAAVHRHHIPLKPQTVLPYILHQFFHGLQ